MNNFSMKKAGILLTALIIAVLTGCVQKDFDQPPINIPYVDFTSNFTIKELKAAFVPDTLNNSCMMIKGDTIIQGIIVANDESGNIYKTLYIQDNSGGLQIGIDQTNLYSEFKLGQKLYIKCQGLFLGTYGGVIQLGYPYNGSIGRMPSSLIAGHIYKDSLPGPVPTPAILDFTANLEDKISTLVEVDDISFPGALDGLAFCDQGVTTNRDIADALGNVIKINNSNFILRTSNYASFAYDPLPSGTGRLIGILSAFNSQYQMYLRDTSDLVGFNDTTGTKIIYVQNFDASPPDWTIFSVASNKDWTWSSTYTAMTVNGYGADVASNDWLITPGIDLTGYNNAILSFRTWTKFADSGLTTSPMDVFISTDYSGSGDPTGATWTTLTCTLPAANSAAWTSSGDVDLSAYHQKVYIGYNYKSSGTGSGTSSSWELDAFKVTGEKSK
jgi:hypothetical protein